MSNSTKIALQLSEIDDVAVALYPLDAGDDTGVAGIATLQRIPRGHKFATKPISAGQPVLKYGQSIGIAAQDIAVGGWVHDHNLSIEGAEFREAAAPAPVNVELGDLPTTFQGFRRANGDVGTRNYIALLSTVNCSATVCQQVAARINGSSVLDRYPNVDGVIALTHSSGCAVDPKSYGMDVLQRALLGTAFNPNVGAVVVIGLGCETNQAKFMLARHGREPDDRLKSFSIQEAGGTSKSIERAVDYIEDMLPLVNAARREDVPVSKLRLALQCGGSDAYSGITANPALGWASDLLVAAGGTTILSETPEIYGAEHILAARARSPEIAKKLMDRVAWWRDYTSQFGVSLDNNPSYGNRQGGLSTIYEKSLGAVAKGGSSPLSGVYEYGQPVDEGGFVFVDTPGYDPICSSGQIASGATVMCFTTGRGSVSGFKPVPTLKLATNSPLYERMQDDMDIDCGPVLTGTSMQDMGRAIYRSVIATASGQRTKSEDLGFGDHEFVPWQPGPIL